MARLGDINLGNVTILGDALPKFYQHSYRLRVDDGTEAAASWLADTNIGFIGLGGGPHRIRFCLRNLGDIPGSITPQLQYNKNGAGWNDVDGSSSVIRSAASPYVADGAATTEQLSGPGTFTAGEFDDSDGATAAIALSLTQDTEVEFCVAVQTGDVVTGDIVQLRVVDGSTAIYYTQTPQFSVSTASARVSQIVLESLIQPTAVQEARVSQIVLEVLTQPTDAKARVSQLVFEVLLTDPFVDEWIPPGQAKPPKPDPGGRPGNGSPHESQKDVREYRWLYLRNDFQGRVVPESQLAMLVEPVTAASQITRGPLPMFLPGVSGE